MSTNSSATHRSRKAIKSAFISLLETTPYNSITIQNIIEKSTYSRGTFYRHFCDKEDLAWKIIEDEVDYYMTCTTNYRHQIKDSRLVSEMRPLIYEGISDYFHHVYDYQLLYKLISAGKFPHITLQKLANLFYERTLDAYRLFPASQDSTMNLDLLCYQTTHMHISYIEYWIQCEFSYSPKYMTEQLQAFANTTSPILIQAKP